MTAAKPTAEWVSSGEDMPPKAPSFVMEVRLVPNFFYQFLPHFPCYLFSADTSFFLVNLVQLLTEMAEFSHAGDFNFFSLVFLHT